MAVYFAVTTFNGRETPALYYDMLPSSITAKGSPLIYCTRLDTLPHAEQLAEMSLTELFKRYRVLKRAGKLPNQDRGK